MRAFSCGAVMAMSGACFALMGCPPPEPAAPKPAESVVVAIPPPEPTAAETAEAPPPPEPSATATAEVPARSAFKSCQEYAQKFQVQNERSKSCDDWLAKNPAPP